MKEQLEGFNSLVQVRGLTTNHNYSICIIYCISITDNTALSSIIIDIKHFTHRTMNTHIRSFVLKASNIMGSIKEEV